MHRLKEKSITARAAQRNVINNANLSFTGANAGSSVKIARNFGRIVAKSVRPDDFFTGIRSKSDRLGNNFTGIRAKFTGIRAKSGRIGADSGKKVVIIVEKCSLPYNSQPVYVTQLIN